MQSRIEGIIKAVYKKWKSGQIGIKDAHPDEETLACFLEGRLAIDESQRIKGHLIRCESCAQALAISLGVDSANPKDIPQELSVRLKDLLEAENRISLLEIILKAKEKMLEIISATGDVLVGQELIPAPVLRSRAIKDFKDEVTVLKDFKEIRVEIKVENKGGKEFNVITTVKNKETQKILKDLRVTLIKEGLELESYFADSGAVTFEHVRLGNYTVEVSILENKIATILLDIRA